MISDLDCVSDDVKFQLAKDGVCETIYRLLETYKTLANTSEARALMKLACDLIILILTGGKAPSMRLVSGKSITLIPFTRIVRR